MLEQPDPLAGLPARRGEPHALWRLVRKHVVRVLQTAQGRGVRPHLRKNRKRNVAVFPLGGPHEIEVVENQSRAAQEKIGAGHLP